MIGTGIGRVYPAENRGLQQEIASRGLVLSQAEIFDPGHAPELAWRLLDPALPGI